MLNNEILQLKSYDEQTGREISNVFPITNLEAVKVENDKNLKDKLTEIDNNIEQIGKKIDSHMENHSQDNDNASIDDTTISKEKTWSSSKIEDFIHINDDVIWSTVQGESLSVDYTKEGYLREVEILGNTIQSEEDLSNIQHLGVWNEEKQGYEIDIVTSNQMFVYEQKPVDTSPESDCLIISPIYNGWNIRSKTKGAYQCVAVKLQNLTPNITYRLKAKAKNYNNIYISICFIFKLPTYSFIHVNINCSIIIIFCLCF